jgi:hypothetical protein
VFELINSRKHFSVRSFVDFVTDEALKNTKNPVPSYHVLAPRPIFFLCNEKDVERKNTFKAIIDFISLEPTPAISSEEPMFKTMCRHTHTCKE